MSTQGYVIGPTEGEHLIRNDGSVYFIRVDPSRGSNNMALGTQQVPIRTGIRVHQHKKQMRCCSFWKALALVCWATHAWPSKRVRQFMFPRAFGMELRIPTVNYCCFGLWHHRDSRRFFVR
jgi:hypothetical protein